MFLEVLHPVFGYTKGSFLKNLAIVGGRNFVIFALIESEPRMQEKPVVFYLMMVYSALEIIRYPYHLLRVYDIEVIINLDCNLNLHLTSNIIRTILPLFISFFNITIFYNRLDY